MSHARTVIGKFIHSTWTGLNMRCGKYKHHQTESKCRNYKNISIEFTRDEFKTWCYENKDLIETLTKPSLDRIDSDDNYTLSNIRIIELSENIRSKRPGSSYTKNGPKANVPRGIKKTSSGSYAARVRIKTKEVYLGSFKTAELAYEAFHAAFVEENGYEPFDLNLIRSSGK